MIHLSRCLALFYPSLPHLPTSCTCICRLCHCLPFTCYSPKNDLPTTSYCNHLTSAHHYPAGICPDDCRGQSTACLSEQIMGRSVVQAPVASSTRSLPLSHRTESHCSPIRSTSTLVTTGLHVFTRVAFLCPLFCTPYAHIPSYIYLSASLCYLVHLNLSIRPPLTDISYPQVPITRTAVKNLPIMLKFQSPPSQLHQVCPFHHSCCLRNTSAHWTRLWKPEGVHQSGFSMTYRASTTPTISSCKVPRRVPNAKLLDFH
jgi:hypothetical protein